MPRAARQKLKPTKRGTAKRPFAVVTTIPADRKQQISSEERKAMICRRAVELKGLQGYTLNELAVALHKEFSLKYQPPIATVAWWLAQGKLELWTDVKHIQEQLRMEQFNELEKIKQDLLLEYKPGSIHVIRTKIQDGEPVEVIDEHAFKERNENIKRIIDIHRRQAALLGLDLANAPVEGEGGVKDLKALQLWIIGQVAMNYPDAAKQVVEMTLVNPSGTTLELRAGGDEEEEGL